MKIIFEMDEHNYSDDMPVTERFAARAIIKKNGKYAMQHSPKNGFKIPGGGIEAGESPKEALIREVQEETGLLVKPETIEEIGEIIERREDKKKTGTKYVAHSFFYKCDVEETVTGTNRSENEQKKGYVLKWEGMDNILLTNYRLGLDDERDTRFLEWLRRVRQFTRVDKVRDILDARLYTIEDEFLKRNAYVHLYGVAQAAAMLALKRGMGRQVAELAEIAGMLHDYTKYLAEDTDDHAERSAPYAKEILEETKTFTAEEIDIICQGIANHSNKADIGTPFDEVIKDADALQHYLRNPMEDFWLERNRVQALLPELGI